MKTKVVARRNDAANRYNPVATRLSGDNRILDVLQNEVVSRTGQPFYAWPPPVFTPYQSTLRVRYMTADSTTNMPTLPISSA